MKLKLFISSLFYRRNIGVLFLFALFFAGFVLLSEEQNIPLNIITLIPAFGVASYLGLVLQSFRSKEFQDNFLHKMKRKSIEELSSMCSKLVNETKRHTNSAYYKKLCSVIEDKEEIVKMYHKEKAGFLKEKITEQALNLVISYIKLLRNFCLRSRELGQVNVTPVMERIKQNYRKLNFAGDPMVSEDIKKVIEMDERIISRLKEEKHDLERIDARLDYIKSTVSMFRNQISMSLESEEMLGQIEEILNEASAFESVLDDRNKKRLRN
jgi:hypothetical protein